MKGNLTESVLDRECPMLQGNIVNRLKTFTTFIVIMGYRTLNLNLKCSKEIFNQNTFRTHKQQLNKSKSVLQRQVSKYTDTLNL